MSWTAEQLALVDAARELDIAVRRADGTLRPWTPIWGVRVSGVEVDVRIEHIGVGPSGLREDVDDAYRDKYGGGSTGNMVGDKAAATTLRLLRR